MFGHKNEKSRYGDKSPQLCFFNMPEPDPDGEVKKTVEVERHTRRKFMDAQKVGPKKCLKAGGPDVALKYIKDLYRIEQKAKRLELTAEDLFSLRQDEAKPLQEERYVWLMKKSDQVTPKSLLGKAVPCRTL